MKSFLAKSLRPSIGARLMGITFIWWCGTLFAQSTTWTGLFNEDWHDGNNWTNGVPNATKSAVI
ncbi:MAG: hypothetical protein NZ534_02590, partial [Bacteroidia bacterium]|nr:hypothetical protein [Bacteroidia bacterium]